ncbi:MAG: ABC transporter ATP-binding protein [Clostridiales bacterium]|nr:ABC transporter ATP-binding protein [Clostridiales bacterium]
MDKILDVKNLGVSFHTYAGEVKAVRGINFYLNRGEALALVGESGCGKTVTAKSLMCLNPMPPAEIKDGSSIEYNGQEVLEMSKDELRAFRGAEISMVFQDPMTSLNPTMKIGDQIAESLTTHMKLNKKEALDKAVQMLERVGIPEAEERINSYPHEFSGGMRQRVMIAIALACNPRILIADEPTTALDVTIQAQVLELLKELQNEMGTSIILVTHDLGVVANFADRIHVMYAGKIVEKGTTRDIFYRGEHPYTWALLSSVPDLYAENRKKLYSLEGTPPDLLLPLEGCPFASRCKYCMQICREKMPPKTDINESHSVSCWLKHPSAPKVEKPHILRRDV